MTTTTNRYPFHAGQPAPKAPGHPAHRAVAYLPGTLTTIELQRIVAAMVD